MRLKTMFTTCWGIFLAAFLPAQNQLSVPPTVRQHLTTGAPHLLAKIDQMTRPVPKSGVEARSGNIQLDSTVLFAAYSGSDSVAQAKELYTYPAANVVVQTKYINAGNWQLHTRTTQILDPLGRQVEVLAELFDQNTGEWVPESRLEVFPHGNSLVQADSFIVSTWDVNDAVWIPALRQITSYDNQDRPVVIFTQFSQFLGQEFSLLDELSYDANGDNHLTIQSIFDQDVWTPFNRIETEFDQHRAILQTVFIIVDDQTTLPQSKTETEYTPEGLTGVVRNYDFDFASGDWILVQTVAYLYDDQNRVTSQIVDTPDPEIPERVWNQTGYFSGEDLLFEARRVWDFTINTWVILEKTFYYYSNSTSNDEVVNGSPLPMTPNPTSGPVRLPASENARITILNAQGAAVPVVHHRQHDEHQVDLSQLPAGVYYISVQEGNQRRTGAVVKQ